MRLLVPSVIVALLGYTVAKGMLGEALDSVSCSQSVEYSNGMILDIKKSVDKGATLLLGAWSESKDSCLSSCCKRDDCDLALFKKDGMSKKGNNCYLVHCGDLDNCLMVQLDSFDSMFLHARKSKTDESSYPASDLDSLAQNPESKNTGSQPSKDQDASTASQTNAPPSTATPPTKSSGAKETNTTAAIHQGGSKPPSTKPGSQSSTQEPGVSSSGEEANEQESNSKKSASQVRKNNKPCGAYGCDGSGVVAVVVVAAICTAIIIVVGAILLKKVVDERRRKKFRNVDYLINGMYT